MDVITTYLDSMFNKIEATEETVKLKEEIKQSMLDKYEDLIASGITEHEAIGKVITEFGSIDELIQAYQLNTHETHQKPYYPLLNEADLNDFITNQTKANLLTALATFLIIASSSVYMTLESILGDNSLLADNFGMGAIIVTTILAIGLFIVASRFHDKPQKIARGEYSLSHQLESELKNALTHHEKINTYAIISGIALILLPIIPIVVVDSLNIPQNLEDLAISGLLIGVASAVFLFIYFGGNQSIYKKLLQSGLSVQADPREIQEKERNKRANKIFDDIYWPLVSIIYFLWSFFTGSWAISWVIFIIGGIIESILRQLFHLKED